MTINFRPNLGKVHVWAGYCYDPSHNQIAKHFGAIVHVVAGGAEKKAKAETLGASFVVDYKANPDWHKELFPVIGRQGYDIVVDNVGKPTWSRSIKLAGIGGRIVNCRKY